MPTTLSEPHAVVLSLVVNDEPRTVAVEPRRVLLDVLRTDLRLTGTKEVCEMGTCGACTVIIDDQPVYSCLVLAVECEGASVETIESLATGNQLHPIQQAFAECDALQCGYCTPGQIMSLEALRRRRETAADPADLDTDIDEALAGNLCRCGAYRHILEAAHLSLGPRS